MDKIALKALRAALVYIGRSYHESACPEALVSAVTAAGFPVGALDGIYTGRDGRALHKITDKIGLVHTWHRMESGRYEVVCYLSQ